MIIESLDWIEPIYRHGLFTFYSPRALSVYLSRCEELEARERKRERESQQRLHFFFITEEI